MANFISYYDFDLDQVCYINTKFIEGVVYNEGYKTKRSATVTMASGNSHSISIYINKMDSADYNLNTKAIIKLRELTLDMDR